MAGPWISDDQLKQKLADILQVDVADFDSIKSSTITDSNNAAWNDILSILVARGYTMAQVDAWDQRVVYNTDIAMFWAFVKGRLPIADGTMQVDKLDRRKELLEMVLLIGGVPVLPGPADAGNNAVSGGRTAPGYVRYLTHRGSVFRPGDPWRAW